MRNLFWGLLAGIFLLMTSETARKPDRTADKFTFIGKVSFVLDADILVLTDEKDLDVLIRLKGIDCPDSGQAFYNNAKDFVEDLLENKKATVHCDSSDYYGRTFGELILPDGRNVNKELLRFGLAWHYVRYSSDPEYAALEKSAREARLGLWKYNDPVPPWVFRRDDTLKTDIYMGTFLEMPNDLPKENKVQVVGSAKDVSGNSTNTSGTTTGTAGTSGTTTTAPANKPRVYISTERTAGPELNGGSKDMIVYICNSRSSHTYHRIRHCTAVSQCEDKLTAVSHYDAVRRYYRNGCRSCW